MEFALTLWYLGRYEWCCCVAAEYWEFVICMIFWNPMDFLLFQAGKFNIVPTLLNIGAGLALLGLVSIDSKDSVLFYPILFLFYMYCLYFICYQWQVCTKGRSPVANTLPYVEATETWQRLPGKGSLACDSQDLFCWINPMIDRPSCRKPTVLTNTLCS